MALPGPLQAEHWFHPCLHWGSSTEQMGPLKTEKDSFLSIQPAGQGPWRSEAVTVPRGQVKQEHGELTSNCRPAAVLTGCTTDSFLAISARLRVLCEPLHLTRPEQTRPHTAWEGQSHGPLSFALEPLW